MSGRIRTAEETPPPAAIEASPAPPPARPVPPPLPEPTPPPAPPPLAADAQTEEGSTEPAKPELPPEVQKRLDRVTWEKYEARRQLDLANARLAQIERDQQQQRMGGQPDPVEVAKQQLREEAKTREFNTRCNDVYRRGQQEYGDFDDAVRALNAVGFGDRPDALARIAAMPEGHRVYRALASDLDNASRVLNLPQIDMEMELTRLALESTPRASAGAEPPPVPSPAVTRAPEPLKPIGGTSRAGPVPLDKTSMADFIRRRDSEERRSRISR